MTETSLAPILCDLDGVVWLDHVPIPGSVAAIERLRERGHRVLFVTNNSAPRRAEHCLSLGRLGVPDAEVLTSAMAAALLVESGERVLVLGGEGIREAVVERGAEVVAPSPAQGTLDAVIVGICRDLDYERLTWTARAVRDGARLIGANEDATYPTPDGPTPGGGAILAAVQVAGGREPLIAGKPHEPMARLVVDVLGGPASGAWMVGDRASTDGRFARTLGCRFALVRTGVDAPSGAPLEAPEVVADLTADNLADFATLVIGR